MYIECLAKFTWLGHTSVVYIAILHYHYLSMQQVAGIRQPWYPALTSLTNITWRIVRSFRMWRLVVQFVWRIVSIYEITLHCTPNDNFNVQHWFPQPSCSPSPCCCISLCGVCIGWTFSEESWTWKFLTELGKRKQPTNQTHLVYDLFIWCAFVFFRNTYHTFCNNFALHWLYETN
jgi:hypothetical protein